MVLKPCSISSRHYQQLHFVAAAYGLLDAIVEQEEDVLAAGDEAGGVDLAHQDAAMAKGKGAVAGLYHRARDGVAGLQMACAMTLLLGTASVAHGGTGGTWLDSGCIDGLILLGGGCLLQEEHLAVQQRTGGHLYLVLAKHQPAVCPLYRAADLLSADEGILLAGGCLAARLAASVCLAAIVYYDEMAHLGASLYLGSL